MLKLTTIFLSILVANNVLADSVDYLCKVKGSSYDNDTKGKINETISLSLDINNSGLSFIQVIGSEHTEMNLSFGQTGKTFKGQVVSWSNYSKDKTIEVLNSHVQKGGVEFQTRFIFNKLTKVVSATTDFYTGSGAVMHKGFSGTCTTP